MPLKDLPADLAEPLHMLGPETGGGSWWWLGALATGLAWLFFRGRRKPAPEPEPSPVEPTKPRRDVHGLEAEIEELRSVFSTTGNYRQGCHALAGALRQALAPRGSAPFEALTVGEITREIGEGAVARVLGLLEGLQFRPGAPSHDEFIQACDVATATARSAPELHPSGSR